jgi:hypothetical protein
MEHIKGGCQCGQLRYVLRDRPQTVYCCHCLECQKQSASAFGMSMPVAATDIAITGKVESWERATDTGTRTRCFFCPDCGSRVYHQGSASPDILTIKGGSLDDASGLRPAGHIWVSRKQPWVMIDGDVPQHPTQPKDFQVWGNGGMA